VVLNHQRRSDEHLKQVFDAHAVDGKLSKDGLRAAMGSLNVSLDTKTEDVEAAFITMDANDDGWIDLEEFKAAALAPSTVESWAKTVAWWQPIADCMSVRSGIESLRAVARMTAEEVACVSDVVQDEICRMLGEQVAALRASFEEMDRRAAGAGGLASSKFQTFKASAGGTEEYYHGLTGRVGERKALIRCQFAGSSSGLTVLCVAGYPHTKFKEAMEAEHCSKAGFDFEFTSGNYKITTTPRREWRIIVYRDACSEKDQEHGRVVQEVAACLQSEAARLAGLIEAEVIAVIEYTGPLVRRWVYENIILFFNQIF
jgi:hypothetical protein